MKAAASSCRRSLLGILSLTAVALYLLSAAPRAQAEEPPRAKNVIVLIADGCGAEGYTLARWVKGDSLAVDGIRTGAVRTFIADSVIGDSAPTGSAYAMGVRTSDKFISVGPKAEGLSTLPAPPESLRYRPLATVLEGARLLGKSTGIVATSRVTHATPAAYMAHVPNRGMEAEIMEQAVYQGTDLVFGGGREYLLPQADGGKRSDGQNLAETLRNHGYQVIETADQLASCDRTKVFGMFAPSHMHAEIDREALAPTEPTLEAMTRKAIEILSKNPRGFFLMVEGSQVDWGAHANDPSHLLGDLLMYDRAVAAALEFARRDGQTLVIATSDHSTGGLAIGNYRTSKTYSQTSVEEVVEPLKKMKRTAPTMWEMLGDDKSSDNVQRVVREGWGMEITDDDAREILAVANKEKGNPHNAFGRVLCAKYTVLGWTTNGHTGGDVPLGTFGPSRPVGLLDGPQIGLATAAALGLDLKKLNERLFVDAAAALPDAKIALDKKDRNGPAITIEFNGRTARLPVNKNRMELDGRTVELEGVVVYAPKTDRFYIPLEAVRILQGTKAALPSVER